MIIKPSERLQEVKEYYFSIKLKEIAQRIASGKEIVNLGIGSPDLAPPPEVISAMKNATDEKEAHAYKSYEGIPPLRKAMTDFYKTSFGVRLDETSEVLPLMGSKEGITHISMAFLNKGDAVLIPNPGYPTYTSVTNLVGATSIYYDLDPGNDWLPNLELLTCHQDLSKVKIMWLNYPNMPTGAPASEQYFDKLIAFAKEHQILLVNDNPYAFVLNNKPVSILSRPKAKNACIELNSLSKTFNMAGWRIGMVAGDKNYLDPILRVKSNMDSGMFYPLQIGAIKALSMTASWIPKLNKIYSERRLLIWELLEHIHCVYRKDYGGMFVWGKLPKGMSSETITDKLLNEYDTFVTPGSIFGSNGSGYIRLSLCVDTLQIQKVIQRIKLCPLW